MDLLLDPVTHDLIYINGETLVTQAKADVVAQRLKIKLNTFLGEWFLDLDVGIPYFQQILNKVRNKSSIDAIFQTAIIEDPDVVEMISYSSNLDGRTRVFSLDFAVRVIGGEIIPINFELLLGA